jgi:hypothetical protein
MTEQELEEIERGTPTGPGDIVAALVLLACILTMIGYVAIQIGDAVL